MNDRTHSHSDATRWSIVGVLVVAGFAAIAAMNACSTTEGFGKDVKDLGEGIEESAAENS